MPEPRAAVATTPEPVYVGARELTSNVNLAFEKSATALLHVEVKAGILASLQTTIGVKTGAAGKGLIFAITLTGSHAVALELALIGVLPQLAAN